MGWVRGRPLSDFGRRRPNLPLPQERVKIAVSLRRLGGDAEHGCCPSERRKGGGSLRGMDSDQSDPRPAGEGGQSPTSRKEISGRPFKVWQQGPLDSGRTTVESGRVDTWLVRVDTLGPGVDMFRPRVDTFGPRMDTYGADCPPVHYCNHAAAERRRWSRLCDQRRMAERW